MRVFHHVLLKFGHENAEMQKRKFDDVTLRYSITHLFLTMLMVLIPSAAAIWMTACPAPLLAAFCITVSPTKIRDQHRNCHRRNYKIITEDVYKKHAAGRILCESMSSLDVFFSANIPFFTGTMGNW